MDAKTNIKSRLPSRHVTEGPARAPHRSYLYAMGLTTEQIHQPLVGVASCWNEAAPCNIALMRQAQAAPPFRRLEATSLAASPAGTYPAWAEVASLLRAKTSNSWRSCSPWWTGIRG